VTIWEIEDKVEGLSNRRYAENTEVNIYRIQNIQKRGHRGKQKVLIHWWKHQWLTTMLTSSSFGT
jgi:hypothetical protein